MTEFLGIVRIMSMYIAMIAIIVLIAMMVDLVSGIYKAYLRGDARRSEALKRTGYKFILYEGSILIAAGVDAMIHMARVPMWFGWELVYNIPMITILIGIFWCFVEFMSVREKADEKTHSDIAKAEKMATAILKIVDAIRKGDTPDPAIIEDLGKDLEDKK